jgi:hypothetical protein
MPKKVRAIRFRWGAGRPPGCFFAIGPAWSLLFIQETADLPDKFHKLLGVLLHRGLGT